MLKILLSNWNVLFFGVIKGLSLKLLKLNDLSNLFFEKENKLILNLNIKIYFFDFVLSFPPNKLL